VSSTRRNREAFLASEAVAPDPTFGPDFVAYRIPATTHILGVGASLALGERASLNLGYDYVIGDARDGIEYRKNLVRLGLLFSF
jgi:hypothetical protein